MEVFIAPLNFAKSVESCYHFCAQTSLHILPYAAVIIREEVIAQASNLAFV